MYKHLQSDLQTTAVEGMRASGAKGIVPDAGQEDPDPDWQPV